MTDELSQEQLDRQLEVARNYERAGDSWVTTMRKAALVGSIELYRRMQQVESDELTEEQLDRQPEQARNYERGGMPWGEAIEKAKSR
jgi:hypothetical protein